MDRMRAHITALCAGWDVEQVRRIVDETLHDIVDPLVYNEATQLIADHKAEGHDVVVVSRVRRGARRARSPSMVGATHSVGTRMVVADGRYTGEIDFYCDGENKAIAIKQLAAEVRLRPRGLLRLLGLGHRPADAGGRRPPDGRQPGPRPAQDRRAERGWPVLHVLRPGVAALPLPHAVRHDGRGHGDRPRRRRPPPASPGTACAAGASDEALKNLEVTCATKIARPCRLRASSATRMHTLASAWVTRAARQRYQCGRHKA